MSVEIYYTTLVLKFEANDEAEAGAVAKMAENVVRQYCSDHLEVWQDGEPEVSEE